MTDPSLTTTFDANGDGLIDTVAYDADGDGLVDTVEVDADGDGLTDTVGYDTNGDGTIDTVLFGDGTGAQYVMADTNGDGTVDTFAADTDGDGIIDWSETEGGTGVFDDPSDPVEPTDPAADISGDVDNGPFVTDDLPDAGDDGVHGDPRADIEYHQVQPGPVDCLPTSVAMTISEATGTDVPAEDVVALANEHGFMGEGGMAIDDAVTLFEEYGLDTEVTAGTVDDLRAALDAGEPIIVGIDAADLYSGDGGALDQGMTSGHAVVVTGIDDGPPGYVYINDPGFPDGAGLEIPLEMFEDAWDDSDHALVVATPEGQGDLIDDAAGLPDDGTATADGLADHVSRVLFLPLTFRAF